MTIRLLWFAAGVVLPAVIVGSAEAQPSTGPGSVEPGLRQQDIDAVAGMADARADDWATEIDAQRAGARLNALAKVLVKQRAVIGEDVAAFFTRDCRLGGLRRGEAPIVRIGEIPVRRDRAQELGGDSGVVVRAALSALFAPHRRAVEMRIKCKIVGVETIDANSFSTDVLFQAYSHGPDGRVQQNARWSVLWTPGEVGGEPLIRRLTQSRFDEVVLPKPLFLDCTRSVVIEDGVWDDHLALGCEYWYGRIDAVGEINLMGHNGIAVGDVNGDGLDDLYVAQGTGLPNLLFIQNADGTVRETAGEAGVAWLDDTKGVLLVDLDNDGDQDLLCAMGPTIVYCRNDGTGRFTPHRALRASSPASFYSLAAADYDADGDLDIYACRYVKLRYGLSIPIPFHDANNGPANHLLRNDGDEGFKDVTREAGLHINNGRFSVAAAWIDDDDDSDPDLYVTNDFGRNNLYRNDGGTFVDVAARAGAEDQAAGMGVSWADYDLDGDFDLYVSNMFSSAGRRIAYQSRFLGGAEKDALHGAQRHSLGNTLLVNQGDGTFRDDSTAAGVRMGRWAWGSKFVDFNNDGFDDLIVPNGFLTNEYKDDL